MYYKPVDKKEPRFRMSKYRHIPLQRDMYQRFKEKYPNLKVDYNLFKNIVYSINDKYIDVAITERDGVYLPCGMGRLQLRMFKLSPGVRQPDKLASDLTSTRVTHFDFHSDSFVGKIIWSLTGVKYNKTKNTKFYCFLGHRTFKNKASSCFKTHPEFYKRDYTVVADQEYRKRPENARTQINSQISNQPSEDSE